MNEGITLQQLEAELKQLDAQRELVLRVHHPHEKEADQLNQVLMLPRTTPAVPRCVGELLMPFWTFNTFKVVHPRHRHRPPGEFGVSGQRRAL